MSFDLAVWEGDRPVDNEEAARVLDQLYTELIASGERIDPSPRIAAYVEGLSRTVARHRKRCRSGFALVSRPPTD